ncbi:energy transducer TonB [Sphingomonas sp. J315]|uniref:energy transducer TonB n=1 Tax=Sphingomonas sp. J315 TaxID=2898433 RepID=UPI0021AE17FD|nr:energy transducer TonB [Sphingomonas sp. J315]UUY01063.1 TonB family protein [Sphingomonas sp. J315]
MHTERYQPSASRRASAGASLIVLALVGFGATLVGPGVLPEILDPVLNTTHIPLEQPKPEPEPVKQVRDERKVVAVTQPLPHQPDPIVKTTSTSDPIGSTTEYTPITNNPPADPGPPSGGVIADPPKPPVLIGATVDPRYSDSLQPPYPTSEIRAQTEGKLTARVLVGVDGRVKAIEILRTPSKGLSEATRRHALARWRFKPATRDGVPYEDWMTMTLNFRLVD